MSTTKISAIIQARTDSKRLPNKIFLKIKSKPLIWWLVRNLKKSVYIDDIILATSDNQTDDKLADYCKNNLRIKVFRGSKNDVLDRVTKAATSNNVEINVECYGDSPLLDPNLIDEFILDFLSFSKKGFHCLTNAFKKTYPAGMEILVYKTSSLNDLNSIVKKNDPLREHVGFNFCRFTESFNIKNKLAKKNYNFPNYYIEVDTINDFYFLRKVINSFKSISLINLRNIIKVIKKKKLFKINENEHRKWKVINRKYCQKLRLK
jgi:spore coat polysaccharide biosynthesis protein SpsF